MTYRIFNLLNGERSTHYDVHIANTFYQLLAEDYSVTYTTRVGKNTVKKKKKNSPADFLGFWFFWFFGGFFAQKRGF